jgi:hypothetical protein
MIVNTSPSNEQQLINSLSGRWFSGFLKSAKTLFQSTDDSMCFL